MDCFDKSMYEYYKDNTSHLPSCNKTLMYYGKAVKKARFEKDCETLSGWLLANGATKGQNVIICLPNIPNAIISFYAVNSTGAVANIVHPLISGQALRDIIDDMKPVIAILFDEFYSDYKPYLQGLDIKIVLCGAKDYLFKPIGLVYSLIARNKTKEVEYDDKVLKYRKIVKSNINTSIPYPEIKGEDIAVYMHSGGTTGKSKTVMLSNRAFNCQADNATALVGGRMPGDSEGMLMVLPIFHTFGLGICMHTTLCACGQAVLMPKFNAKLACYLMDISSVTFISGVPNMFAKMIESGAFKGKRLKKLKHCYCGGDKLSNSIKESFYKATAEAGNPIRLNEGYGLTEAGVCCVNTPENYREGSLGKPFKNTYFGIFDDNDNMLPVGSVGNLCISGNTVMSGYYNDEEGTKNAFFESQGKLWVRTGDMARLDSDGYAYFVDRKKRVVKISGINVFPQEIENVVNKVDGVKRCCAIQMKYNGKPAIKLIVQAENCCDKQKITQDIQQTIEKNMLKYNMPKKIEYVDSMPLTQIGKVNYRILEEEESDE